MIVSLGACGDIKPLALSPYPSIIGQIEGEVEKNPKSRRNFHDAVIYMYLIVHIIHIMGSWARVRLSSPID